MTVTDPDVALFESLRPAAAETFEAGQQKSMPVYLAWAAVNAGAVLLVFFLVTRSASGWWPLLAVTALLGGGGVTTAWLLYKDTTPGIQNHGVWFKGLNRRGWAGWVAGIGMTAFYCILYWWKDAWGINPLEGGIAVLEPLSQLLRGGPSDKWFLYGFAYTMAVIVMGVRMAMKYRHSRYHLIRTASVAFFQLGFAFILPGLLKQFSQAEFYFSYFWPLKPEYLLPFSIGWTIDGGSLGRAMILWGALSSFVAVPLLTYRYGKRWYCSWVCGCGGLAETLGDPWRQLSDNSQKAWKIERWMIHSVLVLIVGITGLLWVHEALGRPWWSDGGQDLYYKTYGFVIGAAFSGVIGVGFYPVMGSRVWCRFGCPQAAILGLIQRFFSRFRITTNGGQCISCGNCSTYCEMGIDVRDYAQKGRNIVRASCVGCGICAAVCPRGVLKLEGGDRTNRFEGADAPLHDMLRTMGVLRAEYDQ
jgi:ferredoxin-type protein NapH